ncbi:MAG: response regulator [Gemmatimonadetes bacterium]|nr:response regulator [Gemmatimonadota bacterium]
MEALRAIFPPDQQAIYDLAVRRSLHEGAPYEVEVATTLPSGREVIVRAIGEVERDEHGAPVAMYGAVQDVTDERRRERSVRESERVFRTLASASPSGVVRTAADGSVVYANPRVLALFGMTFPEFQAAWRTRIHPDDVVKVQAVADVAADLGHGIRAEYRIVVDGAVRHVRSTTSFVQDDEGAFSGKIAVVEDITADVAAREQAARFEAEVRHAQKLESLGVLAGGIAHDFNNLLVGVLTNAGLALDALPTASPVHELVTSIERAAQRAADLTRQLLAYSGRGRLVVGPVDLSDAVREMADLLRTVVSKRARVVLDLARGLPSIEGDATQVRQVVMNLITNASDALGDRDGTITLRTRLAARAELADADAVFGTLPDDPVLVALEVTDDGVGMDAATMQRIFDPFFTTKFTGRGLGLSAAQGIVRGHRGVMTLRSKPGAGTRFTILLPATSLPPVRETDGAASNDAAARPRGRVLVVDDDESVRTVLSRLLRGRGYVVEAAADGRAALEMVRREPAAYQAVLLDLTMPVMNGRETFAALRPIAPGLAVIMMSGYTEDDMGAGDGPAPAAVLQKPFMPADVFAVLERLPATSRDADPR